MEVRQHEKPEEFESEPNWNSVLQEDLDEKRSEVSPTKHVEAIEKAQKPKLRERVRYMLEPPPVSKKRRHLLFMNPGTVTKTLMFF